MASLQVGTVIAVEWLTLMTSFMYSIEHLRRMGWAQRCMNCPKKFGFERLAIYTDIPIIVF